MSKSEDKIARILYINNIYFEREKTFNDLKKGKYRFDFYIPKLKIVIEYDGQQHFKQVVKFQKTRRDFLKQQEHDREKNSYCLSHSLTLIRIPYWELDNIKELNDLFKSKYLVLSKWHNDLLNQNNWRRNKCYN